VPHVVRRRLASTAVVAGLLLGGVPALAGAAFAARPAATRSDRPQPLPDSDVATRQLEVRYANAHWNWTAWDDSTPVAAGSAQPAYQCAEFVSRSLAAAGLVPGLGPNDPQSAYLDYTAPNGKVYDLLLISDLPQYNNLSAYLTDSGIGQDAGDQPGEARPGDIVVTYLGPDGTPSHTGLVASAPTATAEATVDAHNNARLGYGYHAYAPAHLVRLVPNALLEVWTWAAAQHPAHTPAPRDLPAPAADPAVPVPADAVQADPAPADPAPAVPVPADPAAPQV
jgi:hypothetical protein